MRTGAATGSRADDSVSSTRTEPIARNAAAKSAAVASNATPPLVQSGASVECDQGP